MVSGKSRPERRGHRLASKQQTSSIGEQRRQAVIQAAYHAIAEKGFEGLRIQEIATQVGIHHSTLYHYFPTKEDLIREVIAYLRQELITVPATVSGVDHNTPLGQIRSMFLQVRFRLRETPETFVVLNEFTLRSLRDPVIREMVKQMDSRWRWFLIHTLTQGMKLGTFRADLDLEKTANELMLLLKGIVHVSLTEPEIIDFDHLIKDVEKLLSL